MFLLARASNHSSRKATRTTGKAIMMENRSVIDKEEALERNGA